jgi:hypothetical protein
MLSNFYQDGGMLLDYIQDATLYNCKLSYCFLEDLTIDNSPIGLLNPNEARFTNVTLNNLLVTQGNIGIDVANPAYKLDVNGDINFTGNLFKNGLLYTGGGGGTGGNGTTSVYLTRNAQNIDSQTIASGLNVLKFPDSDRTSSHIVYNSTTGTFSVSLEGLYSIFVDVDFYNADKAVDLYILKNGVEDSVNGRIAWVNCPANDAITINANVYLEAGDFITVYVYNYSVNSFSTPYANNKVNSFAMALFNSSQWDGDKGYPISYTAGSVTMKDTIITNLTVENVLVTVGNVGIGYVADPAYKLDVNGDINITGDLYKNDILYIPRPVYITRSAKTKDAQNISTGVNVLKFPDSGETTGDINYSNITGRFTVNQDGLYSIFVDVDFYNADKAIDLYILKNGIEDSINGRIAWINCPANDATSINAMVYLQETNYITVIVKNNSAISFSTPYDNNKVNSFAMSLMNSSSNPRSSQWLGDIGDSISYTSGSVIMTASSISNSTITNVLITNATVSGDLLITGNSLKAISNSNTLGNIFTTGGNVGIGTGSLLSRLHVDGAGHFSGNTYIYSIGTAFYTGGHSNPNAGIIYFGDGTGWRFGWNRANTGDQIAYIADATSNVQANFTGQHRCVLKDINYNDIQNYIGLIVCAKNNEYINMSNGTVRGQQAITINESLPYVSLSNISRDKSVFGIISDAEDPKERTEQYGAFITSHYKENGDTRVYINSIGEGALWVSNINGHFESGDYITSSSIPGYGMKQNEVSLCNFTVAKITMDCDFNPELVSKLIILKDENGNNVLDQNGNIIWIPETDENNNIVYERQYKIRYIDSNGAIISSENYDSNIHYIAAFVGCTYHCG